ncbi:hypothetical protein G9A89_023517 [Geosiphon pyriformis]|nr:hypothetical protein G9A89_023517 [Geosiphon pyriformis]
MTGCQKPMLLSTGTPKNFNSCSMDSMPESQLCADTLKPNYCNEYDLMFNLSLRILFPITKLPEPEEEILITKDMLFQDPTEDTETEQYLAYSNLFKELELKWYSDNKEKICSERAHDTDAASHSLIKIDLKIVLEIPVSTMVQVASRSSLAKKEIDIKRGIIDASYIGNIIMMLQNNLNRLYKIESQEKIAQAIFLPLVKILQLTLLGVTVQEINGFKSSRRGNVPVNFTEENSNQVKFINTDTIQDQALLFKASPKICSLTNVANLYLPAKAYKHFKIPIHNPTEDVIEIPKGTLISSISADIQNPEKPQSIPDFAQLFLFCNITSQYVDVFASKNEFRHINIVKHQIDTGDARLIKQRVYHVLSSGDNLIKQEVQ